jgi:orotidine-5'-phosphate decarboxylase
MGRRVKNGALIFALDYPSLTEARRGVSVVAPAIDMVKVGLELFVEAGPDAVGLGKEVGKPVFLDLKLHDIPETVERAVARASHLGARLLTVHAAGGTAMLQRAAERARREGGTLDVAAVTVLTSLDAGDLHRCGIEGDLRSHAVRLAKVAWEAGVTAFICSPQEVAAMRAALGTEARLITPGVRPKGGPGAGDDQKRTASAGDAIRAGANALVVGRPIRDAADPLRAAQNVAAEIQSALTNEVVS